MWRPPCAYLPRLMRHHDSASRRRGGDARRGYACGRGVTSPPRIPHVQRGTLLRSADAALHPPLPPASHGGGADDVPAGAHILRTTTPRGLSPVWADGGARHSRSAAAALARRPACRRPRRRPPRPPPLGSRLARLGGAARRRGAPPAVPPPDAAHAPLAHARRLAHGRRWARRGPPAAPPARRHEPHARPQRAAARHARRGRRARPRAAAAAASRTGRRVVTHGADADKADALAIRRRAVGGGGPF